MDSDTTEDTIEEELRFDGANPTGVARCDELDGQSEPYLVNGVAIGANEVTHGSNGPKFWPAEELRRAVETIVGSSLTKNHDDESVESVVGEVIDAGFEPGVGIVFEAEIDDEELATKVARGRLEVSVHALHTDGGRTSEGELIVEDVRFLDLSLVPRGGSPSNFVEAGESPSEVLASLSTDDMSEMLSDETNMTEETDTVESEEAEIEAEDTETDEVSAELEEQIESLQSENQELRNELESVRLEYAEQLSHGGPFEAAELASKFTFDELREKFDKSSAEDEATPAPQTGDAEDAELSTQSSEEDAEIAELESKIEKYETIGWDAAKKDAEERLDDIRA